MRNKKGEEERLHDSVRKWRILNIVNSLAHYSMKIYALNPRPAPTLSKSSKPSKKPLNLSVTEAGFFADMRMPVSLRELMPPVNLA